MNDLNKLFPDAVILPCLGNNDQVFHYQVPGYQEFKELYYKNVHVMWFGKYAPRVN